jgi:hypothetical protein
MTCHTPSCQRIAGHRPVIVVKCRRRRDQAPAEEPATPATPAAPSGPEAHERAKRRSRVTIQIRFVEIGYCDEHQEKTTISSLLSDEGGAKITKYAREHGLGTADTKKATLSWEKIPLGDKT